MPNRPIRKAAFYILLIIFFWLVGFDAWRMMLFVRQGPRFTAQDGQALCERVKALEEHSYGFANAGLKPLDCNYGTSP